MTTSKSPDISELRHSMIAKYRVWRREFFDLPFILLLLNPLKQIVEKAKQKRDESPAWEGYFHDWEHLRSQGEQLARSRTLFTAAEALGQLPTHVAVEERAQLLKNLGSLIQEGNSLHKVRALRAMSFIASDDCIPYLEQGMYDTSPWVTATALRVLLRLNLTSQMPRQVLIQFVMRSFHQNMAYGMRLIKTSLRNPIGVMTSSAASPTASEMDDEPKQYFSIGPGLIAGLMKERDRRGLAAMALGLWIIVALWMGFIGLLALMGYSLFMILATIGIFLIALLSILGAPLLARVRVHSGWPKRIFQAALDYAVCAFILVMVPIPVSLIAVTAFSLLMLLTMAADVKKFPIEEGFLQILRVLLLFPLLIHLAAAGSEWSWPLGAVFLVQVVLVIRHSGLFARLGRDVILFTFLMIVFIPIAIIIMAVMFSVIILFIPLFLVASERWLVESIRSRIVGGRQTLFRDFDDYFRYVLAVARAPWYPVGARIYMVSTLSRFPLADPALIARLEDVAAEPDIAPSVKDAIYQIIDSAEKRIQRGQIGGKRPDLKLPVDEDVPRVNASRILRPFIMLVLVFAIVVFAMQLAEDVGTLSTGILTNATVWLEGLLGAGLAIYALVTPGRTSLLRRWAFAFGGGLLAVIVSHQIQFILAREAIWNVGEGSGIGLDVTTLLPLIAGLWLVLLGLMAGRLFYLLDTDTSTGPQVERDNLISIIIMGIAAFVITAVQSPALQDIANLSQEPMPIFLAFAESSPDDVITLADFPSDGRMVRVALVALKDLQSMPGVDQTFPVPGRMIPGSLGGLNQTFVPNDFDQLTQHDEFCRGEIWLIYTDGTLQTWESLPNGCIEVAAIDEMQVSFRLRENCRDTAADYRLVATVYNATRSGAVRERAQPNNVRSEFAALKTAQPLLASTLSVFSRSIWSEAIHVSGASSGS